MVRIRNLYKKSSRLRFYKKKPTLISNPKNNHFPYERTTLTIINKKNHRAHVIFRIRYLYLFQTKKIITKFTCSLRENYTNNYKPKKNHRAYVMVRIRYLYLFQTKKIITKFTCSLRENYTNNYKPKKNHRAYVMVRIRYLYLFQTKKIITKFTCSLRENYTNNYKPKKKSPRLRYFRLPLISKQEK